MRWVLTVLVVSLLMVGCVSMKESKLPKPFPIEPIGGKIVPYDENGIGFRWGVQSPYDGWTYRLNISPMNSDLTYVTTTTSLEGTVTGLKPGGYVWWVEVVSPDGSVSSGDIASFYYDGPGKIRPVFPNDGSRVPSGELELSWETESSSGVYYYEVEICSSKCEMFSTVSTGLKLFFDEGHYSWKIKALMTNGGTVETPSWRFDVFRRIRIFNPPNGVDPDNVLLEWEGCNTGCEVVLTSNGSVILDETVNGTGLFVSGLDYSNYYEWYVSKDDTRSDTGVFRTHDPKPPTMTYPIDGETGVDLSEFLKWTLDDEIFNVDHYLIYFSETPNPASSVQVWGESVAISDVASSLGITLRSGDSYYWAVQAVDNLGRKTPKTFRSFRLK